MLIHTHRTQLPAHSSLAGWHLVGLLALGSAALMLSACGEEEQGPAPTQQDFELSVLVDDQMQNPVPQAPVLLDGKTVGYTDKDGVFKAVLSEYVGTEVSLGIGPMDSFIIPETAQQVITTLKRVKTLEGYSNTPLILQATLQSVKNDYLIWIEADCAEEVDAKHCQEMPVMLDGKEIARTDRQGRAHFDIRGIPDQAITVSLKTPTYRPAQGDTADDVFDIRPPNPSYQLKLGFNAEVLVIHEKFSDPEAAKRQEEKRARRAAANAAAARRNAATQQKAAAEKAKKEGVIDLW